MPDIYFVEGKEGTREALCSRCAADVDWHFLDEQESRIQVICPDCGRFEMSRAEFDQAESDMVGPSEPYQ